MKSPSRSPGRRHMRAAAAVLALAPMALHGPVLALDEVNWTDWTSGSATGAAGTVALPTGRGVDVTFAGQSHQVFTGALPQPYWGPSTTYTGTRYSNPPPNSDLIVIAGGPGSGRMTLSFSEAVTNPVLAIASLGLTNPDRTVNIQTSMLFDQPFEVMSNGPNFYAGGQFTPFISVPGTPNALYGTESSGVIRFRGTFTELSWTSPLAELNGSGDLVGTYLFTLGTAPCGEYQLEPLTGNDVVRLGCTAYTRGGAFDQQFQLDVRGTLRAETFFTLAGTQVVAASGRSTLQQGGLIAPAATLDVYGRLDHAVPLEVAGRVETRAGSTWGAAGLVVQPMADVVVAGSATFFGVTSVNGRMKVAAGGNVSAATPLLVGGTGARLEVTSGGQLQAVAGLQANSDAQVVVGGLLSVANDLQLSGARLEVQNGGVVDIRASGNVLATVINAGTLSFNAGDVTMTAGAFTNTGQLTVGGGRVLLQPGVVLQNLATGRVELSGSGALGLNGAAITNLGQFTAAAGSTFEMAAGSVLNAGTLQTHEGSSFTVISGVIDNSGTLRLGGDFLNSAGGSITTSGQMVLGAGSAATSQTSFGQIVNTGTLSVAAPALGSAFNNAGNLRNQGQFTVEVGAQFLNDGTLFNLGTFTVDGLVELNGGSLIQSPSGRLVVNGRLRTAGGLEINDGSVGGSGVIDGSLILTAGTSALPGNSPGTLTVTGVVDLRDGARLELEVGRSGAHDRLRAGSFFQGSGSIVALNFIDGLQPGLDQTFDVLEVTEPGASVWLDTSTLQGLPPGTQTDAYRAAGTVSGETLGLAFSALGATRVDPIEISSFADLWVGAGEQRFADAVLGTLNGRLTVEGTLGLRRDAVLRVGDAVVGPGAQLLSSAARFEVVGPLQVSGEFVQRGQALIGSASVASGGAWHNRGSLQLGHPDGGGAELRNAGQVVHAAGTWRNETTDGVTPFIDNGAGATFDIAAPMTGPAQVVNAGQWRVAQGGRVQDLQSFQQSAGRLHVDGVMQTEALRLTGGMLSGRGRVEGPVLLQSEAAYADPGAIVLRPGDDDGIGGGVLSFAERIEVGMGTVIEFVIGADAMTSRLQLLAGADFHAGSATRLVLAEGFLPGVEMSWTLIELPTGFNLGGFYETAGAYMPVFARGAEGDVFLPEVLVALRDSPDGVEATLYPAVAVPEPGTYGLMLAGVGVLAWLRRRRADPAMR